MWCGVILNRAGHHSMENELSRIPGIRTQDVWAMVLRSGKMEFFWLWESPVWASDTVECFPQGESVGHCVARVEEWKLFSVTVHWIAMGYNDIVFIYLVYFKKQSDNNVW